MLVKHFWEARPAKRLPRDRVIVESCFVKYILWRSAIAVWDRLSNILTISDCGWRTRLTMGRLNGIISRLDYRISSHRGKWIISKGGEEYVWAGTHVIYLDSGEIHPAQPRRLRPDISKKLARYYAALRESVEKRMMKMRALDGDVFAFYDGYGKRRRALIIKISREGPCGYRAWLTWLRVPTMYSCIANPARLFTALKKNGLQEVRDPDEVMEIIRDMQFTERDVPDKVLSTLALAKMLS